MDEFDLELFDEDQMTFSGDLNCDSFNTSSEHSANFSQLIPSSDGFTYDEDSSDDENVFVGSKRKGKALIRTDMRASHKMKYCFHKIGGRSTPINFPQLFTMHMNTGDTNALRALFEAHMSSNSVIRSNHINFDLSVYMSIMEAHNDMHPDRIMLVDYSKVRKNQVHARLCYKLTDLLILRRLAAAKLLEYDRSYGEYLMKREQLIKDKLFYESPTTRQGRAQEENFYPNHVLDRGSNDGGVVSTEQKIQELLPLMSSEDDLQVYGFLDMRIDFDRKANTISRFTILTRITSLSRVVISRDE